MQNKFDLDKPQKQATLNYAGDGIADMIVGAGFLGIGLMLIGELPFVPVWLVVFLVPVSWGLKRLITVPRLSADELLAQPEHKLPARTLKWILLAGVLLLAGTVLATALTVGSASGELYPFLSWGMITLALISVFVMLGLLYRAWRYALYALLVLPVMGLVAVEVVDFPPALAGLGAVVLLSGLMLAARFVATHPRLQTGFDS